MMWQQVRWPLLLTVLAGLAGLFLMRAWLPPLPAFKAPPVAAQPWQLPATRQQDPTAAVAQLRERNLWGEPAAVTAATAADKPLTPPDWKIAAVIQNGSTNQIVISFNDNPANLQTLKVGDQLPGGTPILRIAPNWVLVSIHGKPYMLAVGTN